jgi:hypothetical protein
MKRKSTLMAVAGALCVMSALGTSEARVVRFVVEQTRPFAPGTSFGNIGVYERLDGTAYMEVDPQDPHNNFIVDLNNAPTNASGKVEFSSPFFILKPVNMANGNKKIHFGINNRGNKIELQRFNFILPGANNNDPLTLAEAGDGFLMKQGYSFVDIGWQGDLVAGSNRLVPNFPVARQPDGSSILGVMRIEYSDRTIPLAGTFTLPLEGSANYKAYETADTNTSHATLTVRDDEYGPKTPIPPGDWAFGRCPTGQASLVPTAVDICLFSGFKNDKLYELIYAAKNPIVMGLGHAVARDIASFLRNELVDSVGNPNPLATAGAGNTGIRRVYASGSSQTGGYLRDFVYLGFNADEAGRRVFDAVNINIGGTDRVFINVRFADPNIYSAQDTAHDLLQTSYPPHTYAVTTDPISGITDGIMKRPDTDPLVIDTTHETEYFQLRASLNLTDGLGHAVDLPPNVRAYMLAGFHHGALSAGLPQGGSSALCQYPTNTVYEGPTTRALMVAMDQWADLGIEPPGSEVPEVRKHTLVSVEEAARAFPAIPGIYYPRVVYELELLDFGPLFGKLGGVRTIEPPIIGASYKVLVPKPDEDGINVAGVHQVETAAPLGTLTGWNLRATGHRPGNLCSLSGTYVPFAKTRAERLASGDPRKSLAERYKNHDGYVKAVEKAARKLVHDRLLLEEDVQRYIDAAAASDVLR